jgi:hypothetical protein
MSGTGLDENGLLKSENDFARPRSFAPVTGAAKGFRAFVPARVAHGGARPVRPRSGLAGRDDLGVRAVLT